MLNFKVKAIFVVQVSFSIQIKSCVFEAMMNVTVPSEFWGILDCICTADRLSCFTNTIRDFVM